MEHGIQALLVALVNAFVHRFIPHRHAEVRPNRNFLVFAIVLLGLAALFGFGSFFIQTLEGDAVILIVGLTMLLAGLGCVAAYFRYRVYFRSLGIYVYRLGWQAQMMPYAGFERVEMGYWTPLKLVRADGSFWTLPLPDHDGGLAEVIWRLRRAGLPTPDAIALRNRFGLTDEQDGSRRSFYKARAPR